ncbi:phosphoglycolate phosphatase [Micractinium conductrix]|uniref:Phosphoglycolate phosphatase n=1 Tax=Micractinium conductrix TaxID=554055 RepID=A0A2P6VDX2_9CHLO|nr:phosphoglycolate phosphatase [Micractinium conductrix]|eukprot:PSC72300.1 phosphoglycolate phosphatase [Micractinium conductrix]
MTGPRAGSAQAAGAPAQASCAGKAVRLTAGDVASGKLLEGISTVILDCDGVLWRGADLLPRTVEALQRFRAQGKRLLFLTNNASKSRVQYAQKFLSLGIEVAPEEIVPASYTAAAYLAGVLAGSSSTSGSLESSSTESSSSMHASSSGSSLEGSMDGQPGGRRVFMLGTSGLGDELATAGLDYVTWEGLVSSDSGGSSSDGGGGGGGGSSGAAAMHEQWSSATFGELQLDASIGAVLVGWDPAFSYAKLCYASALLRELPGVHFVQTNPDDADRMGDSGRMMPGTGCLVAAVEAASGRRAFNVGKGGAWLLPWLCQNQRLQPSECAIVGDRLDTDILLGLQGRLGLTVLPLTGVTTEEDLAAAHPSELPHYVVPNLAALAGLPTDDSSSAMQHHTASDSYQDTPVYFQIVVLERQIFAWVGVAPPRLANLQLAMPTRLDPLPSATSLLGSADDELASMSQRLSKRTGRSVALSVNLPANQPLMRAFAEKRLLQELRQLQLVQQAGELSLS